MPLSLMKLLENSGMQVSPPDVLDDDTLAVSLKALIDRMAQLGAYVMHTNHLSDRELYDYLYREGLREEAVFFPENPSYEYMSDLTGSGSDEDNEIYLKYYADDEHRRRWAHDWPDDPLPEREEPPFDRDRFLPQSPLG